MDKYDMYEIERAIRAYSADKAYERSSNWRSESRQWDRIVHAVCTGCGKPLSRYETRKRLAFCFECREILFPETVTPREGFRRKTGQGRSREPFL